ncbi:MAG: hypothetical protein AB1648_08115 [Pseudomonadota bacterium]
MNKPFDQRQPDTLVVLDGPDAFADTERAQREFDAWYQDVWLNLPPEEQDRQREEARGRIARKG